MRGAGGENPARGFLIPADTAVVGHNPFVEQGLKVVEAFETEVRFPEGRWRWIALGIKLIELIEGYAAFEVQMPFRFGQRNDERAKL